ncbi:MAG: DnaJ domain-containing protein [Elusimicrobia bacterium]|nr:DnaJ domain-containing protein [Elusimicrobiota bacterium]
MIRFWIAKRNRSWLKLTAEILAVSFLFTTISTPFVHANLWQDRRIAAKELQRDETLLARLPSIEQNIFPTASTQNLFDSSNSSLAPLLNQKAHLPNLKVPLPQWVTSNPLSYATLKKVLIPSAWKTGDPIVIYIQDAHLNQDAQRNIGKSIQHFIDHGKPDLVALEGAFGPIDLSSFRDFPNQDAVQKVADYLLKENKISGAIHTAFTSPSHSLVAGTSITSFDSVPQLRSKQARDRLRTGHSTTLEEIHSAPPLNSIKDKIEGVKKDIPSFIGVDDRKHYDANVEAYKRSYPKIERYKEHIHSFKIKLEEQKSEHFSQKLKAFDQKVELYRNQKIGLGEYIKTVTSISSMDYQVISNHSQIRKFLKALEIESSLNFKEVEKERAALLEQLIQSLSKAQMQELLNVSMVYRLGNIKHADFYVYLQKFCEQNRIDFKKFPAMDAYLKYVLLSDEIVAEQLFEEVKVLEEKAYHSLVKSKEEKEIVSQSKILYLIEKLVSCSLTREEWNEYKRIVTLNSPMFQLPNFLLDLRSFEDFYQESFIRDEKIANNLLNLLSSKSSTLSTSFTVSMSSGNRVLNPKSQVAVLVTGGFHSEGIEEILNKSNVTVITYTPKIAKVDTANGAAYLSVFTQEKTALQKLFDGEKLFLPPEAYPSSLPPIIATHIIGVEEASDSQIEIPDEKENIKFHRLVKTVSGDIRAYAKDIGDGIAATTSGDVTFNLEIDKKDGSIHHTTPQRVKKNIFVPIAKALKEKSFNYLSKARELRLDQVGEGLVEYGNMIAGLAGAAKVNNRDEHKDTNSSLSAASLAGYKGFNWDQPRLWLLLPGNINHEVGHMITGLMAGFIALPFFPIKYRIKYRTTIIAGIGVKGYSNPQNEWEYEVRRWRLALFYAGGFLPVVPVLALLALTNFFPFNSTFSPTIIYGLWAFLFVLPYLVDVWLNLPSNRKTYSEKVMTDLFQFLLLKSKGLFTVEKGAGLPMAFTMAGGNEPLQVPISRDKMLDTQPFLETFTKDASLLENQDLVNKANELLEKRDLVNEANDFVANLFNKNQYSKRSYFKPCLRGFKVVEIPEYGFLSGEKLVPFFHDPDGFIYLTRGLFERIHADPFKEQILFELAVHYSFRLNFLSFAREGGSAERLIQEMLEGFDFHAKRIFILNYLPVVSEGRLQGEQEKGFGPVHLKGDENEAIYYFALFLERYARFRKLGYRPQGSDRMVGGPEDIYRVGLSEWLDFRDWVPNKSFLTLPGKLSEFLENLEDTKEIKVGAETFSKDEIEPEFRANLAGENLLYVTSMVYDYSQGSELDMSKTFGALNSYKQDRFVTGLLATFVRRYGKDERHFIRGLFGQFKAEDLIQIIVQLNRLARKANLKDTAEYYGGNETSQLMNILHRITNKSSLDLKTILGSLEKLNAIFDLLNRNVRHLGKVGEVVSILNKFLDKSGTQGELCLTVFQEILSSTDPKNLTLLLRIISEDPNAITNLDRIKSLLEKIKQREVDFTDIERANQIPLFLVELILTHSSFPNEDLRTVSYHGVINYKLKENVPEDMEALYSRGYRWMDALFFKGIEKFLEMEKEIEQRISQDPHFVPTIRTIVPHQDYYRNELSIDWQKKEPHLNLMIFASKFLKTDSGKVVPLRVIKSLWIHTANALNPLFPKEYEEQQKVKDSFNDLKDRLCRIAIRMLKKENKELDPILFVRDLNILVQRMNMAEVESLLESLEIVLEGADQELINPFIESLTYFAETMSYEEGRDEITQALGNLKSHGIAQSLESALQKRLDYEDKKFPEIPLEETISRIDGLDNSQKADLQEKLQIVLAYEQDLVKKTQKELKARAFEIRSLVENQALSFDELKLEYLAILREISKRLYGMRAYNVQLTSVLLFFENSEMNPRGLAEQVKTGEGKSLIIALTAGLSSLSGKPVDIFTVNSYLAKRDAIKFKRLYDFLGLTVDHIKDQEGSRRSLKESNSDTFSADIVYGTNSNFEFLYLYEQVDQVPIRAKKSNGVTVKREFATAIVDEVDSLFLDEAVNPHLISGFGRAMPTWHYQPIYQFFKGLTQGTDFHGTELTPIGEDKYRDFMDQLVKNQGRGKAQFSLVQLKRYARSALQAERIQRDVDYVVERVRKFKMTHFGPKEVEEEDIIIIDKATGRKKEGSVWNHGLHQFVQIKEGISPREEFKPGASITHPFYFKFYEKIFAITGTIGSDTDEKELLEVYGLQSLRLPNHKPSLRIDQEDYVARTLQEKWDRVVAEIEHYHKQGRPVLVGVMTIRESEELHKILKASGIEAQLLNGTQNQPEETIIQRAGYKGVITIATNLAGRGTDILLGPGVVELGGLHVIGTQRFDARRVDDQLRGRAGRQGQPGSSQFIISLQDEGFRRYLGPLALVLGSLTHHPQEARREIAIETQKAAEIMHYQWRISRNQIYSVQDDHMNRFFRKIGEYFNVQRIYEIFPELVAEYQQEAIAQMDSTQSLFLAVREKVFDYWTNHLQLLEDLTEDFEDETGPSFETGFSNYKKLAEESFQDVLGKLRKDVYSIYGRMAGLSETEVAERIDRFKNGSGEGDLQADPQALNADGSAIPEQDNPRASNTDGSAIPEQDNSGRGKSDESSSSESEEITFNDLVERCRQASFPFDLTQLISILLDTKKLKSHKERIQIYFWFMRFPDIFLVMEAVKDLAELMADDPSLNSQEFQNNLSEILSSYPKALALVIHGILSLSRFQRREAAEADRKTIERQKLAREMHRILSREIEEIKKGEPFKVLALEDNEFWEKDLRPSFSEDGYKAARLAKDILSKFVSSEKVQDGLSYLEWFLAKLDEFAEDEDGADEIISSVRILLESMREKKAKDNNVFLPPFLVISNGKMSQIGWDSISVGDFEEILRYFGINPNLAKDIYKDLKHSIRYYVSSLDPKNPESVDQFLNSLYRHYGLSEPLKETKGGVGTAGASIKRESDTLYARLGVSSSATRDEIKTAYRQQAKIWHPDLNPDPEAGEIFISMYEAYQVLSDPKKRAFYDRTGMYAKRVQREGAASNKDHPGQPMAAHSFAGRTTAEIREWFLTYPLRNFFFALQRLRTMNGDHPNADAVRKMADDLQFLDQLFDLILRPYMTNMTKALRLFIHQLDESQLKKWLEQILDWSPRGESLDRSFFLSALHYLRRLYLGHTADVKKLKDIQFNLVYLQKLIYPERSFTIVETDTTHKFGLILEVQSKKGPVTFQFLVSSVLNQWRNEEGRIKGLFIDSTMIKTGEQRFQIIIPKDLLDDHLFLAHRLLRLMEEVDEGIAQIEGKSSEKIDEFYRSLDKIEFSLWDDVVSIAEKIKQAQADHFLRVEIEEAVAFNSPAFNPGGMILFIKAPLMAILKKLLPQEWMPRISNIYDLWIVFVLENWLLQNFVKPFMPQILQVLGLDFVSVNAGLWGLFLGIHLLDYMVWNLVNVIEYALFKTQSSPRAPPPSNMLAAGIISFLSFAFGLDPLSLESLGIHFLTNFAGHYIEMFRSHFTSHPISQEIEPAGVNLNLSQVEDRVEGDAKSDLDPAERKFVETLKQELYGPYFEDAKRFPYDENSLSTPQPENWGTSVRDRCVDVHGNPTPNHSLGLNVFPEPNSLMMNHLLELQEDFSRLSFANKFYITPAHLIHFTALLLEGSRKERVPKDTIEEKRNDFEENLLADLSAFDLWLEGVTVDKTSGRIMAQVFPLPKKDGNASSLYLLRRMNPNAKPRITITLLTPFQPLTEDEREGLGKWLDQNRNRIFGRMHVHELKLLHNSHSYGEGELIKSYGLEGVTHQKGIKENLNQTDEALDRSEARLIEFSLADQIEPADGSPITTFEQAREVADVLFDLYYNSSRLFSNYEHKLKVEDSLFESLKKIRGHRLRDGGSTIIYFGNDLKEEDLILSHGPHLSQHHPNYRQFKIGNNFPIFYVDKDAVILKISQDRLLIRRHKTEKPYHSDFEVTRLEKGEPITPLEESREIHEKFILVSGDIDEIAQKIVDLYDDQNVRELVVLSSDQDLNMPLGKQYRFAASCVFGSNLAKPMDESGGFISMPVAVTKDSVKESILISLGPLPEGTKLKLFVDTYSQQTKVAKVVPMHGTGGDSFAEIYGKLESNEERIQFLLNHYGLTNISIDVVSVPGYFSAFVGRDHGNTVRISDRHYKITIVGAEEDEERRLLLHEFLHIWLEETGFSFDWNTENDEAASYLHSLRNLIADYLIEKEVYRQMGDQYAKSTVRSRDSNLSNAFQMALHQPDEDLESQIRAFMFMLECQATSSVYPGFSNSKSANMVGKVVNDQSLEDALEVLYQAELNSIGDYQEVVLQVHHFLTNDNAQFIDGELQVEEVLVAGFVKRVQGFWNQLKAIVKKGHGHTKSVIAEEIFRLSEKLAHLVTILMSGDLGFVNKPIWNLSKDREILLILESQGGRDYFQKEGLYLDANVTEFDLGYFFDVSLRELDIEQRSLDDLNQIAKRIQKSIEQFEKVLEEIKSQQSASDSEFSPANPSNSPSDLGQPVNSYQSFYNTIRQSVEGVSHISEEDLQRSRTFLTLEGTLKSFDERRANGTFGITEVYFLPESETQARMAAFQDELRQRFGNKLYFVDPDKLHFTTQGLELQWDNKEMQTKKELAMHNRKEDIDPEAEPFATVRTRARQIETPVTRMQVGRVNWNPEIGIFWELQPYLKEGTSDPILERYKSWEMNQGIEINSPVEPDPILDRRNAWDLPQPRPPHITAAYFAQAFSEDELLDLRNIIAKYQGEDYFGDIVVDKAEVIAYEDLSFNAGVRVLETVPFAPMSEVTAPANNFFLWLADLSGFSKAQSILIGRVGLPIEIAGLIVLGIHLSFAQMFLFLTLFTMIHVAMESYVAYRDEYPMPTHWEITMQFIAFSPYLLFSIHGLNISPVLAAFVVATVHITKDWPSLFGADTNIFRVNWDASYLKNMHRFNFPKLNLLNWKHNVLILIAPVLIFLGLPGLTAEGRITIEDMKSPTPSVTVSPTPELLNPQPVVSKTKTETVVSEIVTLMADLYKGKEIKRSSLVDGLKELLKEDLNRKIGTMGDPFIQSNVVLQAISQLNQDDFKKALAEEFRKRFGDKLSKEQANVLATQVVLNGFSTRPLEQILSESEIDNNALQIVVADPENPVKHILLALTQYKPAADKLKEGKKLSLLFILDQELSDEQKRKIENQAGEKISAAFLTAPEVIEENRLVVSALDERISHWKNIKSFDKFNLIIPRKLIGNLSMFLELPKNSYLHQAAIHFIDEMFNALPVMQIGDENFKRTRRAIALIAQQA